MIFNEGSNGISISQLIPTALILCTEYREQSAKSKQSFTRSYLFKTLRVAIKCRDRGTLVPCFMGTIFISQVSVRRARGLPR